MEFRFGFNKILDWLVSVFVANMSQKLFLLRIPLSTRGLEAFKHLLAVIILHVLFQRRRPRCRELANVTFDDSLLSFLLFDKNRVRLLLLRNCADFQVGDWPCTAAISGLYTLGFHLRQKQIVNANFNAM